MKVAGANDATLLSAIQKMAACSSKACTQPEPYMITTFRLAFFNLQAGCQQSVAFLQGVWRQRISAALRPLFSEAN
jgi:hypothetical protein